MEDDEGLLVIKLAVAFDMYVELVLMQMIALSSSSLLLLL
jgi:hypothetical protein